MKVLLIVSVILSLVGCSDKHQYPKMPAFVIPGQPKVAVYTPTDLRGTVSFSKDLDKNRLDYWIKILPDNKIQVRLEKTVNNNCATYVGLLNFKIVTPDDLEPSYALNFTLGNNSLSRPIRYTTTDAFYILKNPQLVVPDQYFMNFAGLERNEHLVDTCDLNPTSNANIVDLAELDNTLRAMPTWLNDFSSYPIKKEDFKTSLLLQSFYSVYLLNADFGFIFNNDTYEIVGVSLAQSYVGINKKIRNPGQSNYGTTNIFPIYLSGQDFDIKTDVRTIHEKYKPDVYNQKLLAEEFMSEISKYKYRPDAN